MANWDRPVTVDFGSILSIYADKTEAQAALTTIIDKNTGNNGWHLLKNTVTNLITAKAWEERQKQAGPHESKQSESKSDGDEDDGGMIQAVQTAINKTDSAWPLNGDEKKYIDRNHNTGLSVDDLVNNIVGQRLGIGGGGSTTREEFFTAWQDGIIAAEQEMGGVPWVPERRLYNEALENTTPE